MTTPACWSRPARSRRPRSPTWSRPSTSGVSELGVPASMLTDNGAIFTAESRRGACAIELELLALGVDYKHSRPYHPQTCGKVERFHQTLKKWLAKQRRADTVAELQAQLDRFRTYYNTVRPHRALGRRTPAQAFAARTKATPRRPGSHRARPSTESAETASTTPARSPSATSPSSCTSASAAATPTPASCSSSPTATCASSTTTANSSPSSPSTRPSLPNPKRPARRPGCHRHPSGMSRDTTMVAGGIRTHDLRVMSPQIRIPQRVVPYRCVPLTCDFAALVLPARVDPRRSLPLRTVEGTVEAAAQTGPGRSCRRQEVGMGLDAARDDLEFRCCRRRRTQRFGRPSGRRLRRPRRRRTDLFGTSAADVEGLSAAVP